MKDNGYHTDLKQKLLQRKPYEAIRKCAPITRKRVPVDGLGAIRAANRILDNMEENMKANIGKGKIMSVAKAALIVFHRHEEIGSIYTGDLNVLHEIIDVAGANHASFFTGQQVVGRLNSSPYWKADYQMKSWCGNYANMYEPSEKGLKYYKENLQ